jgi:Flp pilus assembly pilin Flp
MMDLMRTFWNDESGQDMAEYGLLLVLIAVIVAAAVIAVPGRRSSMRSTARHDQLEAAEASR